MPKPDIVIVVHELGSPVLGPQYIMGQLWRAWERSGHRVRFANGVQKAVPGDIAVAHIDLTLTPDEYLDYLSRYPVAINAGVKNISKDRFSAIMLKQGDAWGGPVIVKTKNNYGGYVEANYASRTGQAILDSDLHQRPWRKVETLDPYNYPVFESLALVPPGVWKNPNLIVEKFLSERDEKGHHVARHWHFMGDREFGRYITSPDRIVKPTTHFEREIFSRRLDDPVPEELRELRRRMAFDFGRFDYGIVDGHAIVYDTNTTPVMFEKTQEMFRREICEDLPRGLETFISG